MGCVYVIPDLTRLGEALRRSLGRESSAFCRRFGGLIINLFAAEIYE